MKKTITILVILIAFNCTAQERTISVSMDKDQFYAIEFAEGDYFKDTENKYDIFTGTWEWTNGNSSFIIVLEKTEKVFDNFSKRYYDYVVGRYKYVQNSVEVVNTLDLVINNNNMLIPGTIVPIMGRGYISDTKMDFGVNDILKDKLCNASFEILTQGSETTAKFMLWNKEHWNIDGENPLPDGFSIPTDIILSKQ